MREVKDELQELAKKPTGRLTWKDIRDVGLRITHIERVGYDEDLYKTLMDGKAYEYDSGTKGISSYLGRTWNP